MLTSYKPLLTNILKYYSYVYSLQSQCPSYTNIHKQSNNFKLWGINFLAEIQFTLTILVTGVQDIWPKNNKPNSMDISPSGFIFTARK